MKKFSLTTAILLTCLITFCQQTTISKADLKKKSWEFKSYDEVPIAVARYFNGKKVKEGSTTVLRTNTNAHVDLVIKNGKMKEWRYYINGKPVEIIPVQSVYRRRATWEVNLFNCGIFYASCSSLCPITNEGVFEISACEIG